MIIGIISFILGSITLTLGLILTKSYLNVMAKRTYICECHVVDIGLLFSILVNFGIGSILFGLHLFSPNLNLYAKSFPSIILGISLFYLALVINFGGLHVDADIKINFSPYFISGIIFILGGFRIIGKKLSQYLFMVKNQPDK